MQQLESMKVTVAVVTPVYNDLKGLTKTAESVLSQDFPLTWIVVDADSGSDHRAFLNGVEPKTHDYIWTSEKDKGLYDGMNKGFGMKDADLYLFLNANDVLATNSIVRQVVDSFLAEKWLWAVGLAVRFDEDDTPTAVWEYLKPEIGGLALGTRTFCHQAIFYSKNLLDKVMPYDLTNLAADHLLNIKAFSIASPKMLPLVTTLFANGGISSQRPVSAAFKDLRKIRTELGLHFVGNKQLDFVITKFLVLFISFGGFFWHTLRILSRKLVKDEKRIHPETEI
jgi:glycosyltransferase involved in cell wall biosynthesis